MQQYYILLFTGCFNIQCKNQNNLTIFALTKNSTFSLNVYTSANILGLRHVLRFKFDITT